MPAWMTMMTSRQPGQLGIYGFRNRADHSYERVFTATEPWTQPAFGARAETCLVNGRAELNVVKLPFTMTESTASHMLCPPRASIVRPTTVSAVI